jgi:DNA-binding LacI/PurR family transcriptional regulator
VSDNHQKKLTLKTISHHLGISKTTVSLVLKGDGDRYRISRETQDRIRRYAESTGYRPDFHAAALTTKKTATVGLVFPEVHETFMSEMIKGIESVLYPAGYSMLLTTSGFSTEIELRNIRQLLYRKADGLIIVPCIPINIAGYTHSYLGVLSSSDCPAVFADRIPPDSEGLDYVVQNDYEAASEAVRILHKKGCRKPGCLSFSLDASSVGDRIRGYTDTLMALGPEVSEGMIIRLDRQDSASDDLKTALSGAAENSTVDGLLVTTGGLAHKAGYLIRTEPGLRRLKDIPIAKFGKDPEYFDSGMIQIVQPNVEMGRRAAETLLDKISGKLNETVQLKINCTIADIRRDN